jgi:peptide-methionine (S)-S-oxide reductase
MTKTIGVAAGLLLVAVVLAAGQGRSLFQARQEAPRLVPPPALDAAPGGAAVDVAVLAGGCFWGVQGVYQHTTGVIGAVSGYAGGEELTATYDLVGTGTTGHAEAVRVTFDPGQISYGQLLQIYFSVVHDPTQLDRQGPDAGPQYRSAIFPGTAEQASIAKTYIAQLNDAGVFPKPIVTTIESDRPFYPAEAYHQDYMTRHPRDPYIMINDLPKVADLKRLFPKQYRPEPVLVGRLRS